VWEEGGGGTMYTHVSKCKNDKRKKIQILRKGQPIGREVGRYCIYFWGRES
jgi:hypothetical protein